MASLYRRGKIYHMSFYVTDPVTGKRRHVSRSTGAKTLMDARRVLNEELARVTRREGVYAPQPLGRDPRLAEIKAIYFAYLDGVNRPKKHTGAMYKKEIERVLAYLGDLTVGTLTVSHARAYMRWRKSHSGKKTIKQVSNRTVNKELGSLKRMLNWAVLEGLIGVNPIAQCRGYAHAPVQEKRRLKPFEVDRLLALDSPRRPIWVFMLATGCRLSETIRLRWRDVDLFEREVEIFSTNTKNGQTRKIPMAPKLYEVLLAMFLDDQEEIQKKNRDLLVFRTAEGNSVKNNLPIRFKGDIKRAGIDPKNLCLHSLRYTFASRLFELGYSLPEVMELGGWKTPAVPLKIYAEVSSERKRMAMNDILKPVSTRQSSCNLAAIEPFEGPDKNRRAPQVKRPPEFTEQARRDSNPQPADLESAALPN